MRRPLFAFLCLTIGCNADPVRDEIDRVAHATLATAPERLTRTRAGVDAEWKITLGSITWAAYQATAATRLASDYKCAPELNALRCVRLLEADRYVVTLYGGPSAKEVRVTFAARPH